MTDRTSAQTAHTNTQKLDWRSFMKASADVEEESIKALDKHFSQFVALEIKDGEVQPQNCVNCGKQLTGFLGAFEWGIAHGYGHCSNCRWPGQAHHFIENEKGEQIATIHNVVLQFHPSFVQRRSEEDAA